jgi:hypothetical protein
MKKLYQLLLAMSAMFFVSCSNMEVGFEKESIFYRGGVVYIYLAKDMKSDEKYRVYINGEDTDISLMAGYKTRFGIKAGDTRIEVVHARETADINIDLKASKNYYLRVQKDQNGKIEILQIVKDSIDSSVATTPLYVDEKEQKVSSEKKEKKSAAGVEKTESKQDVKKVEEKSVDVPKEGETTFYYDPLDGE